MFRILYRFLTNLAYLAVRSGRSKDLEIIVLRRQVNRVELGNSVVAGQAALWYCLHGLGADPHDAVDVGLQGSERVV